MPKWCRPLLNVQVASFGLLVSVPIHRKDSVASVPTRRHQDKQAHLRMSPKQNTDSMVGLTTTSCGIGVENSRAPGVDRFDTEL
jgi:hypothetical protein